jgi:hypothetical protein
MLLTPNSFISSTPLRISLLDGYRKQTRMKFTQPCIEQVAFVVEKLVLQLKIRAAPRP